MNENVIYVDCCNTLIKTDTYKPYFRYCSNKLGVRFFFSYWFVSLLLKFQLTDKRSLMKIISYENIDRVAQLSDDYVRDVLMRRLNFDVVRLIDRYRENADVVIVSGGVAEYLKPLAKCLGFEQVLATSLYERKPLVIGEFKVNQIRAYERENSKKYLKRTGFGDSVYDFEMLEYCDEAFFVSSTGFEGTDLQKSVMNKGWRVI